MLRDREYTAVGMCSEDYDLEKYPVNASVWAFWGTGQLNSYGRPHQSNHDKFSQVGTNLTLRYVPKLDADLEYVGEVDFFVNGKKQQGPKQVGDRGKALFFCVGVYGPASEP